MLNTRIRKSKNILFSLILCFAMIISAFTGMHFSKSEVVSAVSSDYSKTNVSSDLLGNYHNFNTTSTATPATPNGWTEISDNTVNEDNIVKGIVDIKDETTFKKSTYHTVKPANLIEDKDDDTYYKNLMINSYKGAGRFGYKSNAISLDANSFYEISVKLYTHRTEANGDYEETDPTASVYLTGLTEDEKYESQVKFENINTLTSWATYSFFIDTNETASVYLELWLGSKDTQTQGAVFFNNVKIFRYSEDYYSKYILSKDDTDTDTFNIISLSKEQNLSPVTNSSFETTTPMGWDSIAKSTTYTDTQLCQIVDASNFSIKDGDTTISAPGSNKSANNTSCLFIYNKEEGYQAIESSRITIEPLSYYKISFWAKSDCNSGNGATVYLVDKSEKDTIDSASLTLATTYTKDSNSYRNDWTMYSFYIYGHENETKEITIQIWMGTTSSKTTGYTFIDDFRMEEVSYSTYSNNSSSTNCTSLNFNNDSDSFVITNSNFNKTSNEEETRIYPLTPTDWTKSGSSNSYTFSGIINASTDSFEANKSKFSNTSITPTRPKNHPVSGDNNNVLMIGSTSENNTQTYSSASFTLNSNSYYKLTYYVFTDYVNYDNSQDLGASVSLTTSTSTLYEYKNINYSDEKWHKFVTYFKTGADSLTANINLKFEYLTGYVFFDDIRLETSNETVFNSLNQTHLTKEEKVVDLTTENFDNRTFNNSNALQTTVNNWTASEQGIDNGEFTTNTRGIVKLSDYSAIDISSTLSGNPNALLIQSLHDTHFAYTSNESYSFTAQTYYKISINVLTQNIQATIDGVNTSNPDNRGARISLSDSNEIYVKNINTNNGWKTYTIYLSLENDLSSKITLALGDTDEKANGTVLFDNLKIETIEFDNMLEELKTADEDTTARFLNYVEEDEEETDDSSDWENDFDWLILPSLLTALALIIAIVGFYARKIKFNRKPKIKTKYDRRKTLDKDIDRKERIALRQQIIDELNAELLSIDGEIAEYTKLAEEQLENLRTQIIAEKEEIKRKKLEIEIKKKEAKTEREKQLKANPDLVGNTKAEKEFEKFLSKLDKQEMNLQKQLNQKDLKLENTKEADKSKIAKFLERKEFIKNEIAKIEAEIESIAKEETEMWEEYKRAKAEAKAKKTQEKAQLKNQKAKNSSTKATTDKKPEDK